MMNEMDRMADDFAEQAGALRIELDNLKAAFAPVADWYNGDGECEDFPRMVRLAIADLQQDRAENIKLRAKRDALIEALTPSAETKGEYIGEFAMHGYDMFVPWDSVKDIMAAIRTRAQERLNQ